MLDRLLQLLSPLLILIAPLALIGCALVTIWQRIKYRLIVKAILRIIERDELTQEQRWELLDKLVDLGEEVYRDK